MKPSEVLTQTLEERIAVCARAYRVANSDFERRLIDRNTNSYILNCVPPEQRERIGMYYYKLKRDEGSQSL